MGKPSMRIPYKEILPAATIIPKSATTLSGALAALQEFLLAPSSSSPPDARPATAVLTGAGISVASGLADYRGTKGTYRVNPTYQPIYHSYFVKSHKARKRYWARSFLGWATLHKAKPNATHFAVKDLHDLGLVRSVITQNVDSFHAQAHPDLPTTELHGYLRSCVCISCHQEVPRDDFQKDLARLNPAWADFLGEVIASGALDAENPDDRSFEGLKINPDGDVEIPGVPNSTFRYPPCPKCLADPPYLASGTRAAVRLDDDGAWTHASTAGVLKPAVVMFGESIQESVKTAAEKMVDDADKLLVLGTSLATYSAWRLVRQARNKNKPIAIVNLGGVRDEYNFFLGLSPTQGGAQGARVEMSTTELLPALVEQIRQSSGFQTAHVNPDSTTEAHEASALKDALS
ncbi:SIR2 family histone deacetylase-like protein [Xylaria intraflava]|nr:SIR2 family histone deacetylase-like protein [Xylaria intraflava]